MRAHSLVVVVVLSACSSSSSDPPATTGDSAATEETAIVDSAVTDTALPPADSATTPDTAVAPDTATTTDVATETAAGDTWTSFGQAFAKKYCVECHASTSTTRNYATIAHVKRDFAKIRCGVATTKLSGCGSFPPPKQFPIDNAGKTNPKPTDAERDRFIAWIDAGLPE